MEEFFVTVKKVRDLQKRFWYSKAVNEDQQDYKRKLLEMCKKEEAALDNLIKSLEMEQGELPF